MSEEIFELLPKVLLTFLLTNIQDTIILINFFLETSKSGSSKKNIHVVLGQYLGFTTLLLLSLIGYTISYILPVKLFGFLGFLIIFFGLNGLYELYKDLQNNLSMNESISSKSTDSVEENEILNSKLVSISSKEDTKINSYSFNIKQIVKVSLVTIANGNDNIAIYVPIFVECALWEIIAYSIGFLVMVGVLCSTCYCFIHFPPIYKFAQAYGRFITPFIFIALGIYILIESKCFPWLIKILQTGQWTYT